MSTLYDTVCDTIDIVPTIFDYLEVKELDDSDGKVSGVGSLKNVPHFIFFVWFEYGTEVFCVSECFFLVYPRVYADLLTK